MTYFCIFQLVEHQLDVPLPIWIVRTLQLLNCAVLDLIQPLLSGRFVRNHDGLADPLRHQCLYLSSERGVDLLLHDLPLRLAGSDL